jgi:hypothetical protein
VDLSFYTSKLLIGRFDPGEEEIKISETGDGERKDSKKRTNII